jgi:hypothetical protein
VNVLEAYALYRKFKPLLEKLKPLFDWLARVFGNGEAGGNSPATPPTRRDDPDKPETEDSIKNPRDNF